MAYTDPSCLPIQHYVISSSGLTGFPPVECLHIGSRVPKSAVCYVANRLLVGLSEASYYLGVVVGGLCPTAKHIEALGPDPTLSASK